MLDRHRPLFEPIRIGSCLIKNRYAMSPMGTFGMTDENGIMNDECIEYYVERARGGAGLIITGMCIVEDRFEKNKPTGVPLFSASVDHEVLKKRMRRLTERVHAYNCKIFLQMSGGFGRASHIGLFCGRAVAPSEVPNRFNPEIIHRPLTREEIHTTIDSFAREAAFAQSVGFDGVEIHALHEGYLLDQFATEYFNQRTDEYGGSFENRYRLSVDILNAVKNACGRTFPVSLRFSPKHCMKAVGVGGLPGEEYRELGRDMPEGIRAAAYLEQAGYDALNVDLGCYDAHFWSHPPVYFEDGMYLEAAAAVKQVVSIPVLVSGRMDDPDAGAAAISSGKCDMVALGRPLLADPELPGKIHAGLPAQVRPCISCNYGCSVRIRTEGAIGCSVNAECAREYRRKLTPALRKKRVLVVGGGPAGMEFARVCAARGHQVCLVEKQERLGGQLVPASKAPFKKHDAMLISWFENQLKELGVELHLGQEATAASILAFRPDCVALANGAEPVRPSLPGASLPHVFSVTELLMNMDKAGEKVTIIGAGQTGVELGLWLCSLGKKVTILNRSENIMKGAYHNAVIMAKRMLERDGAELIMNMNVDRIENDGVVITRKSGGQLKIPADTVVTAAGFKADDTLYDAVKYQVPQLFLLGDASSPKNVYHAIHSAYETASTL